MIAVRLPPESEHRFAELAERIGRDPGTLARGAIEQLIEDLEDFVIAEERMKTFKPGDGIPLAQVRAELGLDD